MIDDEIEQTLVKKTDFVALSGEVTTLKTAVDAVNDNMQTLTQYYNTISLDNINNLIVMVSNLQKQLSRLEQYLFGFELPDITTDTEELPGTGRIQIVPLGIVKDENGGDAANDYVNDNNESDGAIEDWESDVKVKDKVFHLLGYLEDPEEYLISKDGKRKNPTITRLYSLPNIGVSLTGITFGGFDAGNTMQMVVNGNTFISGVTNMKGNVIIDENLKVKSGGTIGGGFNVEGKLSASDGVFENTVYATNGFYQETGTPVSITVNEVDSASLGEFSKEPSEV